MDDLLTRQLASLGQDVLLRRANLRNLVSALTNHEIREWAAHLSAVDLRTDIVVRLPVELLMLIAEYINGTEISNMLNVSKQWRAAWLQRNVLGVLAVRWFPGFLEYTSLQEQLTGVAQDTERLFTEAARRYHLRSLGKFRSALDVEPWLRNRASYLEERFTLDPILHPPDHAWEIECPGLFTREHLFLDLDDTALRYTDGRLAWQPGGLGFPENSVVFVDDLRTQLRKIYRVPNLLMLGESAILVALGDKLVVVNVDRRMFAWHLESNELQQITLPSPPTSCVSVGDVVVLASGISDVAVWTFGHQVRAVDMSSPIADMMLFGRHPSQNTMTLFVDPLQGHSFYGATASDRSLVVYKFTMGLYSETFFFTPSKISTIYQENLGYLELICRRAGSYGDFEIARIPGDNWDPLLPLPDDAAGNTHVIFNIFTSSFSVRRGGVRPDHLHSSYAVSRWNSQTTHAQTAVIATPDVDPPFLSAFPPLLYTASPQRNEERRDHTNLRRRIMDWNTIDPETSDSMARDLAEMPDVEMPDIYKRSTFALDFDEWPNTLDAAIGWNTIHIFEDDDFIVMAHSDGYLVWSFFTDLVRRDHPSHER